MFNPYPVGLKPKSIWERIMKKIQKSEEDELREEIETEYQDEIAQLEEENQGLREDNDNLQEILDEIKSLVN